MLVFKPFYALVHISPPLAKNFATENLNSCFLGQTEVKLETFSGGVAEKISSAANEEKSGFLVKMCTGEVGMENDREDAI